MISEFHLRGWRRISEVEIIALADPDRERAQQRQAEFAPSAQIYPTLDELLVAEPVDFVDIITPPWLHREHCLRAAQANVHIICQKPLCHELQDARQLVAELTGYPKLAVVHENHPFRPWFRHLLHLHRDGLFGTPRLFRLEQFDPREPPERFKTEAARGVLLEYGVHLVDMVRALLGEPHRVSARLESINPRVRAESLAHVVLEYPGATGIVDIAWKAHGLQQGSALFIGDAGEAFFEGRMTRGESARFRVVQGGTVIVDEVRRPTDDYVDAFYLFERAFIDAVLGRGPPPQPMAHNLKTLEVTFAAYHAAAVGQPVVLSEFSDLQSQMSR